jgi:conjugative transfer region protein (TIGR03748 family)
MALTLRSVAATLAVTLLAGCHAPRPLQSRAPGEPLPSVVVTRNVQPLVADSGEVAPEVVRYDRYLLVSTDPEATQRDPLSQIIDIRIPASLHPTIADALRYALRQSGYALCAVGPANGVLYRQPLPGVQYQLGPMRLRTALQVMAGPAWQVEVDDVQRVVCHSLRDGYQLPVTQLAPAPAVVPVTVHPAPVAQPVTQPLPARPQLQQIRPHTRWLTK